MSKLLPSVLESRPDTPDKKFLVETWWDNRNAQLLKCYDGHWPETGIVQVGEWHCATCVNPGVDKCRDSLPGDKGLGSDGKIPGHGSASDDLHS